MNTMSDQVSICNAALSMIGADSIQSLDDSNKNARHCANIYEQTRKSLLRKHVWNCAVKRIQLAPLSVAPAFGLENAFQLPSDFIRVIQCNAYSYVVENRQILCNESVLQLRYVYDNKDESTWDDLLVEAMSLAMSSKLAKPITGNSTVAEAAFNELRILLKEARAINGQEYPSQTIDPDFSSTLLGARFGG